jgi:hypothetical protein
VTVSYTANTDDGEEINLQNAAGERCVYEPAVPTFLGYTVEVEFCQVDPELFAIMTGQDVYTDAFGNVIGFTQDTAVSILDTAFSLEVWAGSPATSGCATEGGSGNFGYILLPFLQGGVLGDFTIENDAVTFTVTNASTRDGAAWGVGPFDVVLGADSLPAPLNQALTPTTHLLAIITQVAPPEAECGARPLLDPDGEALTDVTTVNNGLEVTFTPVPAGTDPWWIDFGDGTWEYSETGGDIVHLYEAADTYTFIAYRGDSSFTDDVTVAGAGIVAVTPNTGVEAGGTAVTVTGFGFTGATAVNFDATPGTAFVVVSNTEITVETPAGTGLVDVEVAHPDGNTTLTDGFTYTA